MFSFDKDQELLPGLPAGLPGTVLEPVYDAGYALRPRMDGEITVSGEKLRKDLDKLKPFGAVWTEEAAETGEHFFLLEAEAERFRLRWKEDQLSVSPSHPCFLPEDGETLVRTVIGTDEAAFRAWTAVLPYPKKWERDTRDVLALLYQKDNAWLYLYFLKRTGTAQLVFDPVSTDLSAFGSPAVENGLKPRFCQFALKYDKMIRGVTADCGMLYLLSLPDRSLLMIDGGEHEQSTDAALSELWQRMREMAEIAPGEKLRLNWFCTHAHNDHTDGFAKLLRLHHEEIELERVIFNFPSPYGKTPVTPQPYVLLSRINRWYPGVRMLKIHTGQTFELAGVSFEALQTHEDALPLARPEEKIEFNDTTTVLKIAFDGMRILISGDITETSARILVDNYARETLHTEVVQVAHHLINNLPEFYRYASPDLALIPQRGKDRAVPENQPWVSLTAAVPEEKCFFGDQETLFLESRDGKPEIVRRLPRVGEAYDGSRI